MQKPSLWFKCSTHQTALTIIAIHKNYPHNSHTPSFHTTLRLVDHLTKMQLNMATARLLTYNGHIDGTTEFLVALPYIVKAMGK